VTTSQTSRPAGDNPTPPGETTTLPAVIGLDLSLTGTGVAACEPYGDGLQSSVGIRTIRTAATRSLRDQAHRLHYIDHEIRAGLALRPDLAVVEGPSYGSKGAGTWDRAGLWWLVVTGLLADGIPVAVVTPSGRSKYATGKGGGSKAAVCSAAAVRYGRVFATDDEADAFVLCAMGLDHLGHPLVTLPKTHRAALDKVAWPHLPEMTHG
jgi:Holliday junction resolvasome RuvABC endonuclease subunit